MNSIRRRAHLMLLCLSLFLMFGVRSPLGSENQQAIDAFTSQEDMLDALLKQKIGSKVPPNYKGDDFHKIFTKYLSVNKLLLKGEFETSGAFEKRLQAIDLDKVFAFAVSDRDSATIRYDPDKELVHIVISTLPARRVSPKVGSLSDTLWSFVVLSTTKNRESSYVGRNVFGAAKTIKRYAASKNGLEVVNKEKGSHGIAISFTMPVSEAKVYKNSMRILLLCKPEIWNDALAFEGGHYKEPTLRDPLEIDYDLRGLNVELLGIWIYDSKTGRIHHKHYVREGWGRSREYLLPRASP